MVHFRNSGLALFDHIAQRFHGEIAANLVTIFETIGNGLRSGGNPDRNALELMGLDTFREGFSRKADNPEWKLWYVWRPGFEMNRNPNLGWQLRGQLMKAQGGKQTDDCLRCALAEQGEVVVFRGRVVRMDIKPPSNSPKDSGTSKSVNVMPWYAVLNEVLRRKDAEFSRECQRVLTM